MLRYLLLLLWHLYFDDVIVIIVVVVIVAASVVDVSACVVVVAASVVVATSFVVVDDAHVFDALYCLLDNIFITFGSKVYSQGVLIALLLLQNCFVTPRCLFLTLIVCNNQSNVVEAFYSASRNLDDLLDIDIYILF